MVVAAAVVALVYGMGQIVVVIPVFLALLVTALRRPLVWYPRKRDWPGLLATWTVVAATLAVLATAG